MSEELLYEKSCGAVVYCQKDNDINTCLFANMVDFGSFRKGIWKTENPNVKQP